MISLHLDAHSFKVKFPVTVSTVPLHRVLLATNIKSTKKRAVQKLVTVMYVIEVLWHIVKCQIKQKDFLPAAVVVTVVVVLSMGVAGIVADSVNIYLGKWLKYLETIYK